MKKDSFDSNATLTGITLRVHVVTPCESFESSCKSLITHGRKDSFWVATNTSAPLF